MWARHIEQQRRSGQTQRAYCAEHGLQPRVFRRWAQRAARLSPLPSFQVRSSNSASPSASTIAEDAPLPHPVQEVLVRAEPRRRWTEDQKLRLVEETFGAGSSISRVARKYGVHTSVLFRWRRQLAGPPSGRDPAAIKAATFAPVQIVPEQLQLPPLLHLIQHHQCGCWPGSVGAHRDRAHKWASYPCRSRRRRRCAPPCAICFGRCLMLTVPAGVRVFLALGPTDMRKGFDGLAMLVQDLLQQNPFSGHLFVFRGRRSDRD